MTIHESSTFYDRLAAVYDVMNDWPARLAFELPWLEQKLAAHSAQRVLDVACGTGQHVIALAQRGYVAGGADASATMVASAQHSAAAAGVEAGFVVSDLLKLDAHIDGVFDAVLCLGNSLPHLLAQDQLVAALHQMRGRLVDGGLLVLHNLNYDLRMQTRPRFFAASGNPHTLVWRFADYDDGGITFHTALFQWAGSGWTVEVNSTRQRPLLAADLRAALSQAEFGNIEFYGALDGRPFDAVASGDLVVVAQAQ
jgi:SAM-dependent methyltransferase